jgi:hypothetical protein
MLAEQASTIARVFKSLRESQRACARVAVVADVPDDTPANAERDTPALFALVTEPAGHHAWPPVLQSNVAGKPRHGQSGSAQSCRVGVSGVDTYSMAA